MTQRVAGKIALITGGASGLGRATGLRLAEEGATVVLTDLNREAGEAAAAEIASGGAQSLFLEQDTTDEARWDEVVEAVVSRFGRLDVLFNNAGISGVGGGTIDELSFERWRQVLAVNLDGVFLGLRAAIRQMRRDGGGSIINTSSIYGIVGAAGVSAYNASKGGVRTLTKGAALECAEAGTGIRVNSIHPGHIDTPMIAPRVATDELRAELVARYPVGHLGEPIDIANAVLFLASDESKFMTGAELVIDGGFTAR